MLSEYNLVTKGKHYVAFFFFIKTSVQHLSVSLTQPVSVGRIRVRNKGWDGIVGYLTSQSTRDIIWMSL